MKSRRNLRDFFCISSYSSEMQYIYINICMSMYIGGKNMNYILKFVKGYLMSFSIFLLLSFLLAVCIKFTSMPESIAAYALIGIISVSTLFLGIFSGKIIGKNGLLWALITSGIFVFLIIFGTNCAYFKELSLGNFNIQYLIPVIIGGIGGIIGVNVKK